MFTTSGKFRHEGKRGLGKKLIAWVEWVQTYAPTCPGCQDMYARRKPPQSPPCDTCRIELAESNEEAAHIYQTVRGQVITRFDGQVIDINQLAVWAAIDGYGIKDRQDCFEKVLKTFYHFLNEQRNK